MTAVWSNHNITLYVFSSLYVGEEVLHLVLYLEVLPGVFIFYSYLRKKIKTYLLASKDTNVLSLSS